VKKIKKPGLVRAFGENLFIVIQVGVKQDSPSYQLDQNSIHKKKKRYVERISKVIKDRNDSEIEKEIYTT
jgi:hypothetical protein